MSELEVRREGRAAILTIARPARSNALSRALLEEFGRARALLDEPDLRAIIITGQGDRAFSAGADLKERAMMSDAEVREQLGAYRLDLGWLETSPVPVVAAINGVALGGGLELALLCDLRIAAPHAVMGLPETGLGIIPGAGGTQRLPRLVGSARAKEMILLGTRLSASEAREVGLIHRVSQSHESLLEETVHWLRPILNGAPIAQAAALEAVDVALESTLEEGLQRELELYERCLGSRDRVEALQAFQEKRKPEFRGE